jgi:UDP-glucose 4-epimerase
LGGHVQLLASTLATARRAALTGSAMDIRGRKFVVVGGAGLIGSHCVDALLQHDVASVVVYDNFVRGRLANLADAQRDPRTSIFEGSADVMNVAALDRALQGADGVFHFAALWLLQCEEFPSEALDVNVRGTFNVMDACVRQRVRRLVFSSSASVYGEAVEVPMKESHPFNNKTFYGATKIAGEALLRPYHHRYGLDYVGLRYMNVYGPRQDYRGAYIAVIMKMLDAIDRGEPVTIVGDGTDAFDFVSAADCGRANVCAMQSDATDAFYNVATGRQTTLLELATTLVRLTGSKAGIAYTQGRGSRFVRHRVGDPSLAASEIGFVSTTALERGLLELIEWRRSDMNTSERRAKRASAP